MNRKQLKPNCLPAWRPTTARDEVVTDFSVTQRNLLPRRRRLTGVTVSIRNPLVRTSHVTSGAATGARPATRTPSMIRLVARAATPSISRRRSRRPFYRYSLTSLESLFTPAAMSDASDHRRDQAMARRVFGLGLVVVVVAMIGLAVVIEATRPHHRGPARLQILGTASRASGRHAGRSSPFRDACLWLHVGVSAPNSMIASPGLRRGHEAVWRGLRDPAGHHRSAGHGADLRRADRAAPGPGAQQGGLAGVALALGVIVVFAVAGQRILEYLNIDLPALQGAGGLLLILVALELLTGKTERPGPGRHLEHRARAARHAVAGRPRRDRRDDAVRATRPRLRELRVDRGRDPARDDRGLAGAAVLRPDRAGAAPGRHRGADPDRRPAAGRHRRAADRRRGRRLRRRSTLHTGRT